MSKRDQSTPPPRPEQWRSVFAAGVGLWLALALIKFGNPIILEHQVVAPSTPREAQVSTWPVVWGFCLSEALVFAGLCCAAAGGRRSGWWSVAMAVAMVAMVAHWFLLAPQILLWDLGIIALALLGWCCWSCWRRPTGLPWWLAFVPLLWLVWQAVSAVHSLRDGIANGGQRHTIAMTLVHFAICVLVFYFGASAGALREAQGGLPSTGWSAGQGGAKRAATANPELFKLFWLTLGGGFLVVLAIGWRQHFGGLEETRNYFFNLPDWRSYPPEFIQKLSSDRIFGTLFYANTLAGAILLMLPPIIGRLWASPFPPFTRGVGISAALTLALGALYWSGSKAGWLILMGQVAVVAFCLSPGGRRKSLVVVGILVLGLVGFGVRYRSYLEGGAKSLSARFDYWEAAWEGLRVRPVFGSGPATFAATYRQFKRPEAEMTRLAHNDFLQQGSDSGWVGLLTYAAWLLGGLGALGVRLRPRQQLREFVTWIGLAGITVQAFVEFWLYIPAIAWPTFFLLGLGFALVPSTGSGQAPSTGSR